MQKGITKGLMIKVLAAIAILIFGCGIFIYYFTLHNVDQKLKKLQTTGGSINISIEDLKNNFISLQQGTGTPQEGSINVTGDITSASNIQGSSLTSTAQEGTSPLNVYSSTLVNNLNADMVDGKHADEIANTTNSTVNNITNTTSGETITAGTTSEYFRGDKTWQTLNKSAVGLPNVENTALSTWAGSTNITTLGTISGNFVATGTVNGATLSGGSLSGGDIQGGTLTGTQVNGVTTANIIVNSGSYADPAWITSLDKGKVGLSNVENTALSTWAGSSNIATIGNVVSGTINGQTISSSANFTGTVTVATSVSTPTITTSGAGISFDSKNITGVGDFTGTGDMAVNTNYGSELVTNGSFTGSADGWTLGTGYTYGSDAVSHSSDGTNLLYQSIADTSGESYGPEEVTDGDFSLDPYTNGWTDFGGNDWTWDGSKITHTGDGVYFWQNIAATAGSLYKVTLTVSGLTAGKKLFVRIGDGSYAFSTNGTHTAYIRHGGIVSWLGLIVTSGNSQISVDNISVKEVTGESYGANYSENYKLNFTVSGLTTGSVTPNLGGESGSTVSANGTYTQYLTGRPNQREVAFLPTNTARFTIDNVSVTKVENGTITVQDIIAKGPKVDVRAYGATGDGKTDDTVALQAAHDSLPDTGGTLYFPPGTFLGSLTLKSNVHVVGSGVEATVLKLPQSANRDVITTRDFASLTGLSSNGGVNRVTLENITIDGNRGTNVSGYGIRKFGAQWDIHDVIVRNCAEDGIWSEGSASSGSPPGFDSMEDVWENLKVHDNSGDGITFKGPHDSMASHILVFTNTGDGIVAESILVLSDSHIWDNSATGHGIWVKGFLKVSDTSVEGADEIGGIGIYVPTGGILYASNIDVFINETGIYLGETQSSIDGGNIYGNEEVGLDIMSSSNNVNNLFIRDNDADSDGTGYGIKMGSAATAVYSNNITDITMEGNPTHIGWLNASGANNTISASITVAVTETALSGYPASLNGVNNLDIRSSGVGTLNQTFSIRDILFGSYASGATKIGIGDSSPDTTLKVTGSICAKADGNNCSGSTAGTVYADAIQGSNLYGSSSASGNLTLNSTSNATKGKILFGTSAYDEVNNRLGIGTNAPSAKLDVQSTQTTGNVISVSAPSSTTLTGNLTGQSIDLRTNYTVNEYDMYGQYIKMPNVTNSAAGTNFYLASWIDGGSVVQNTAAGTNIWDGMYIQMPNITQTTGTVKSTGIAINGGTVTSGTSYALTTSASAGNVGIGITTPGYKLDVSADTSGSYAGNFFNDGNNADRYGIRIQGGADDASGTTYYLTAADGDGGIVGYIQNNAGVFELADVSDERTKVNIQNTAVEGLGVINGLRVVDFNRKQDPDGRLLHGFVAQEVQSVFPDAVTTGPDGMLGISKEAFIPVIVKALQEQQDQINQLSGVMPENLKVKTAEIDTLVVTGDATFKGTLTLENGVKIDTKGPKPACDEAKRGTVWVTQGASGVEDITEICIKDSTDNYIWKKLY